MSDATPPDALEAAVATLDAWLDGVDGEFGHDEIVALQAVLKGLAEARRAPCGECASLRATLQRCGTWAMQTGRDREALDAIRDLALAAMTEPPAPCGACAALRPEVRAFAQAMECELKANDHKGGWKDCPADMLLSRLYDEYAELVCAVATKGPVLSEAADVANFAMMVADVCGALAPVAPPGAGPHTTFFEADRSNVVFVDPPAFFSPCAECDPKEVRNSSGQVVPQILQTHDAKDCPKRKAGTGDAGPAGGA